MFLRAFKRHLVVPRCFKSSKTAFSFKQDDVVIDNSPLLDNFGRQHTYLRISLTERCNLRCKYCMPSEGVQLSPSNHLLTTDEILYLSKLFVDNGIKKIRLTGGEPTVRKDLLCIIRRLKSLKGLSEGVTITTNGMTLTRQLVELQRAGLDGLNISLDTFKKRRFEEMTRRKGIERVLAGIDLALQLDFSPVKVNVVVMRGVNDDEVIDFVAWTKERNVDVRFIEYMPFDGNRWTDNKLVPYEELIKTIRETFSDLQRLQDGPNDTSKAYKIPGHVGRFGFITSMTQHFCGTCNRLRLTADGNLKVCLFGNTEVSLRDAIRANCNEADLTALIGAAVRRKKKQHAETHFYFKRNKGQLAFNSRNYSTLTHIDEQGKARMVDVGSKKVTNRVARATATIYVGKEISNLIKTNGIKKGDVLSVSRLAGIMAGKRTSELIPLCHNITLDHLDVETTVGDETIDLTATAKCSGRTGVEMEALVTVTVAALTVYDMCKAVSHNMVITKVQLLEKTGGKADFIATA